MKTLGIIVAVGVLYLAWEYPIVPLVLAGIGWFLKDGILGGSDRYDSDS